MKEEIIFEEKYSGSSINMRKSLILDDFDRLRPTNSGYTDINTNN